MEILIDAGQSERVEQGHHSEHAHDVGQPQTNAKPDVHGAIHVDLARNTNQGDSRLEIQ